MIHWQKKKKKRNDLTLRTDHNKQNYRKNYKIEKKHKILTLKMAISSNKNKL